MYLVWIKWIFEESRVSLGLVFLNQNFYLSRSQWWFFISHTKCPAVHLWSLTQLLCLKVPQRTDVDAWWVFYSVNGNCEAKTTTKKKHNDHMCVRAAPTFHLFFFPSAEGLALDSLLIFCQFTSNSTFVSFLSAAAETVSWPLYSSHHNIFNTLWLQNQIGASWRAPANVSLAVSHWSQ